MGDLDFKPCTGMFYGKRLINPIANSTKSHASQKLGRGFVDLSGPRRTPPLLGKKYVMMVKDDFTQ